MHQPLSPIQNNSDLAQGPLPIRPSKVRRKLPHVAAELIGWENSDAQDHLVCRCRLFDRDWVRSMGGLPRQCACSPSIGQGIEPHQLMVNAKDSEFNESTQHLLILADEEVCEWRGMHGHGSRRNRRLSCGSA